jgi:hypothetical protein
MNCETSCSTCAPMILVMTLVNSAIEPDSTLR